MLIKLCPKYKFKIELTKDAPKSLWKEIETICHMQNVYKCGDGWWYSADTIIPRERLILAGTCIEDKTCIADYLVSWVYVKVNPNNPNEWLEEDRALDVINNKDMYSKDQCRKCAYAFYSKSA
jgi:hypothetical protein